MTTRVEELANTWPRDPATCWVCGKDILVYRGARTIPSVPALVKSIHGIDACVTCGDQRCQEIEIKRQDALANMLMRREAERRILATTQGGSPKNEEENAWRN